MRAHIPGVFRLILAAVSGVVVLAPEEPVRAQASLRLRVMDWNIHHGVDTSGADNLTRVADWIVRVNPDVVSLNEVEKRNGYNNNADEPAVLEALLESRTGVAWFGCFAQRDGGTTGQGNLLLSRIRIERCEPYQLTASRSIAKATITAGSVPVNVFSTHLDASSASTRQTQVAQLTAWAAQAPEGRIIMGDFNASATSSELQAMRAAYDDTWAVAVAAGTAIAYPGNTAGNTRNSRIDYIWRSKGAAQLALQSVQVYDTGSVSDHRPLSATFSVGGPGTASVLRAPQNLRLIAR